MAISQTKKESEVPPDASEVKRKLAWRMGFAGLMIVGLLGALALFDRLSSLGDSEPSRAAAPSELVPVAKKVTTQPVTRRSRSAPEVAKEPVKEPLPEVSAAPVDRSTPRADWPPRPEVSRRSSPCHAHRRLQRGPRQASPGLPALRQRAPGSSGTQRSTGRRRAGACSAAPFLGIRGAGRGLLRPRAVPKNCTPD